MNDAFKKIAIYGMARAVPAGIAFLFTLICIQYLDTKAYGFYSINILAIMTAASFLSGISSQSILRYGTQIKSKDLFLALYKIPLMAIICFLPFLILYLIFSEREVETIACAIAIVIFTVLIDTKRSYFIAHSQAWKIFFLDSLKSILSVIFLFCFFYFKWDASYVPLIALSISICVAFIVIKYEFSKEINLKNTIKIDKNYIFYGIFGASWIFINGSFQVVERTYIDKILGGHELGIYASIADPLAAAMASLGAILVSVYMPKMIKAWNESQYSTFENFKNLSIIAIVLSAVVCGIVGYIFVYFEIGKLGKIIKDNKIESILILLSLMVWQTSIFFHKKLELNNKNGLLVISLLCAVILYGFLIFNFPYSMNLKYFLIVKMTSGVFYIIVVILISKKSQ